MHQHEKEKESDHTNKKGNGTGQKYVSKEMRENVVVRKRGNVVCSS